MLRGATDAAVLLQDFDQQLLVTLTNEPPAFSGDVLTIDSTPAGEAFTSLEMREVAGSHGRGQLLLPLLDGGDRVGVLALTLPDTGARQHDMWTEFAAQVAALIIAKGAHTDIFFLARRRHPMTLAAEMQWHLLPPLSVMDPRVSLAGVLEPAYEVGGDAFDYAINHATAHLAVFDAMGHGMRAAVMSGVAVSAYRHARRSRVRVQDMYTVIDQAFCAQFGDEAFVTAQIGALDLHTGVLTLVNAGHPAPLHVRGGRILGLVDGAPTLPIGLGGATPEPVAVQLEPGDRIVLYTDGVVDARRNDAVYGDDGLFRDVERTIAADLPIQEIVRQLNLHLTRWRGGPASDDATIVVAEWRGTDLGNFRAGSELL